ncbi:37S ribosomal protein S9, mitochondrial [Rhodotorula kratochvilovae]
MATLPRAARQTLRTATSTRAASTAVQAAAQQFFPVQAAPSLPPRPTLKPPSREWYTARPTLTQTLTALEDAVTASRAHLYRQGLLPSIAASIAHDGEFAGVLPHPRQRRWKQAKDMAAYLRTGAQLKSSQYKRLTAALAHLEGLLPYARVADSLAASAASGPAAGPALVVDPVAAATGRAPSRDAVRGEPSHGLSAQLEALLAHFTQPAAVSSTGVAVERVVGQARRLGAQDAQQRVFAVGRRKESGARVWIVPTSVAAPADAQEAPLGRVLVNTLPLPEYFAQTPHRSVVVHPLALTSALGAFNVFAIVKGGGQAAQADAVAMGVARALAEWERIEIEASRRDEGVASWRDILKRAKLIERDPRVVERKKTGRVKARKMPTWVKRLRE